MISTAELRWFSPGILPQGLTNWFTHTCPGEVKEWDQQRDDWYLLPYSPCDQLNLKLREGRLEIKWRKAQLDYVQFESLGEGQIERWCKWLCQDEEAEIHQPQGEDRGTWIKVTKTRSQRVITLAHPVEIELTQLQVRDQDWWSVAFEVPGDDDTLDQTLQAVAQQVSQTYPQPYLKAAHAYAYPHWLSVLEGRKR
jgi:hypothetical protein